jgi:hypothetical protein
MNNHEKRFQISCPVFWGFNRFVSIKNANSVEECVERFLQIHRNFLFEQNYVDLLNFFDAHKNEYHVHGISFDQLKQTNEIIYVCRHPDNTNEHNSSTHSCCDSELERNLTK